MKTLQSSTLSLNFLALLLFAILFTLIVKGSAESTHYDFVSQVSSCRAKSPPLPLQLPDGSMCESWGKALKQQLCKRETNFPKVIDTFVFNGEFDLLDIRLMTLWQVVDYFVLVESDTTFSERPKKLFFQENKDHYQNFMQKIHYYHFAMPSTLNTTWARETAMRNSLTRGDQGLAGVEVNNGDILLVSDLDEIPRPSILQALKYCNGWSINNKDQQIQFMSSMSYYSFEFPHRIWPQPQGIIVNSNNRNKPAQDIRMTPGWTILILDNSSWHCSYCFRHLDEFVNKIKSFSHKEFDKPKFLNKTRIIEIIVEGKDIFGRSDRIFRHFPIEEIDAPEVVLANPKCYQYMLDRRSWAKDL